MNTRTSTFGPPVCVTWETTNGPVPPHHVLAPAVPGVVYVRLQLTVVAALGTSPV
ncbi:MAG TPA: hypothetical protein VH044_17220 [Polyangiaceae bacterium]|nr:hypothetical protein [Polyangiaceae bacterium]